jgi:aminopeptidase
MINPIYEKLAKLVVGYSLEVEKGHQVLMTGLPSAKELFHALNAEILKVGAYPAYFLAIEGMREIFFKYASEEQLSFVDNMERAMYRDFDRLIQISGNYNTRRYSRVKPEKMTKFVGSPERKKLMEIFEKKSSSGELKWVIVPFGTQADAQEANMDLYSYEEFIYRSLLLDKENPSEEWRNIKKNQSSIVEYLDKVEIIQVIGEDTDLTVGVKDRKWINCSGQKNLPDGEIYTSPIEDQTNGHIRFTYPGIYIGKEVEDIYLEFKDGEVTKATAKKGEELLGELLKIENANRIGEFAIGTNYGIKRFTKNMLFDEKIGGTMHCALGLGFEECGGKNMSSVHWDILKDMKVPGSKILADGKVIYEEGKWKI